MALTIKYGFLYNWYAATDAREITSAGWHVPTSTEFITLQTYLGGKAVAGGKLKEIGTTYWNSPNTGATNEVGFNGKGSGVRSSNGLFELLLNSTYFWTTTPSYDPLTMGTCYWLFYNDDSLSFQNIAIKTANAIRLIKDSTTLEDGETGTYTGNDGRVYDTICIGTQEWLADNLAETKFRNGDDIPNVTDNDEWAALTTGAMCAYDNDWTSAYTEIYSTGFYSKYIKFATEELIESLLTGLVAYYKKDEAFGSTLTDSSPYNYNGLSTATITTGIINNSRYYEGSSYSQISSSYLSAFCPSGGSTISISMWIRINQLSSALGYDAVLYRIEDLTMPIGTHHQHYIKFESSQSDRLYFTLRNISGDYFYTYADTSWSTDTWYHLSFISQGSGLPCRIYRNGYDITTYSDTFTGTFFQPGGEIIVGNSDYTGLGNACACRIDELAIHNISLTEAQVRKLYNLGLGYQFI